MNFAVLTLLFLLTYTHRANCSTDITDDEKAAIENCLKVGSALAEALKEGTFTDALDKLGTNIATFLGVLDPLAGILLFSSLVAIQRKTGHHHSRIHRSQERHRLEYRRRKLRLLREEDQSGGREQ